MNKIEPGTLHDTEAAHRRTDLAPPSPAKTPSAAPDARPSKPSTFYRTEFWKLGLFAARNLPESLATLMTRLLAGIYIVANPRRREIVVQNILPAADGDRAAGKKLSRQLFQNFAQKLVDLWRYESGVAIDNLFHIWSGIEHLETALAEKRGVLILTPHLGNWEFGAPLLAKRGIKMLVITLAEPDERFTELRQNSRARWGIETLVVGQDPFAFVEIIRRLEKGDVVALLVDRPHESSATTVELFGRPFHASVAPAELARATGCTLLPVYLPRTSEGYAARVLPPVSYERTALRTREARQALTQRIMNEFAPAIRQNLNQWYHFVPIWPKS